MKKIKLLIGAMFVLGICCWSSCQKDKTISCEGSIGVFVQVEDCGGLVFELEDGTRLEDTSFRLWTSIKKNGKTQYCVEHEDISQSSSSCQDAVGVEFLGITEL